MSKIDTYKHLDKDTSMSIVLPMEQIAKSCVALNYGAHRLLSALVHELRAENEKLEKKWQDRNPREPVSADFKNSPLADGIEKLLNDGLYR
jgi:hypothetical protein